MPPGVTHRRISGLILVLVLIATAYAYDDLTDIVGVDSVFEYTLLFCLSFLTGTYLLSPDLDLARSDPARSWGIIQSIWRPYSWLFRHRGISHTPVFGTLTRLIYLAVLGYVILLVGCSLMGLEMSVPTDRLPSLMDARSLCVFLGLVASDLIHLVADRFFRK